MANRVSSSNISLWLKLIGIICLLSFFVDFIFLLFPFRPTDKLWQIGLVRNVVDRGIVPLVGLGIMMIAYWFDGLTHSNRSSRLNLKRLNFKVPVFILSSILGLMFLLMVPLHLNNVNQVKVQALQRYTQESNQLEAQVQKKLQEIQSQLTNEQIKANLDKQRLELKEQLSTQLNELIKDEQKYNQALNNNQLPEVQRKLLEEYKTNPRVLDNFIAQQTNPEQLAQQRITQIRSQKEERLNKTQEDASKELRISINSILLSIGYILIGWTGLKSLRVGSN
ncbi:hypothetical protein H6F32_12105 [Anabaena sp. FACHB-1237]|uniref:hormogonium polysaccharide biosynthesis protein HpsJ n=1 Tax=Anabaena sp. FACHB-1237 TaxID=2692769 RepID=UPI00167FF8B5|nr:HpsJ family protein [Anabaena sp. FACHB-1237]MBD2138317.1 hypothetical protein [Anabaena sp. FACHB-1237]